MSNKHSNLSNTIFSIDYPPRMARKFRPAVLLMFLLVLLVLLGGNFWAADEFKNRVKAHNVEVNHQVINENKKSTANESIALQLSSERNSVPSNKTSENGEPAILPITYCVIVVIILFAVGWLLLLYYFPKVMIYILQVVFCIGAFTSLIACLDRLSYFVPHVRHYSIPTRTFRQPCVCQLGSLNICTILTMSISLTLVIIWYVYRHTEWAWVLQNILGAAICITVTSIYRVGNMRVITAILVGFCLYDIFFVFITPYIPIFRQTSNPSYSNSTTVITSSNGSLSDVRMISRKPIRNPSVMEKVALGIGTDGEIVPLLFTLPMFMPENEIDPCAAIQRAMLGFGDVILPGILLTFCKIFDIASNNRWPVYYIQSIISYFIGLSLTHGALYLMNTAQPALLYLVPCLLLSTIITGLCRRELRELYTGQRIQSLLDEIKHKPALQSNSGNKNPIAQQTSDEISQGTSTVSINDKTNFDPR